MKPYRLGAMSRGRRLPAVAMATLAGWAAACGGDTTGPPGQGAAGITIDLAALSLSGAGAPSACDEATRVTLTVRETTPSRTRTQSATGPFDSCTVTFEVGVAGGSVEFSAEVLGNSRLLLSGDTTVNIQESGFDFHVPLDPIPALQVSVDTLGDNAPSTYTFSVDGAPPDSIVAGIPVTLNALAAGRRQVALFGFGACTVDPPGAVESATIPVDTSSVGSASFSVDCTRLNPVGSIGVSTSTVGTNAPAGYTFRVDGGPLDTIGTDATMVVDSLQPGSHDVQLFGFTGCAVMPDSVLTVTVVANDTVPAAFSLDCTQPPTAGFIEIVTSTTGSAGPMSYDYRIGSGPFSPIGIDDSTLTGNLAPGSYDVVLDGYTPCAVLPPGAARPGVTVTAGDTTLVVFDVDCTLPMTGAIRVATTTTGAGGPVGYRFTVDGVDTTSIGRTDTVVLGGRVPGSYTVELTDFLPCAEISGMNPQAATVVAGDTTDVAFDFDCVEGEIRAITVTTGAGGPATFDIFVDGSGPFPIGRNDTTGLANIQIGDHSVFLEASPCIVAPPNPRSVTVVARDSVQVVFDVDCTSAVESEFTSQVDTRAILNLDRARGEDPLDAVRRAREAPVDVQGLAESGDAAEEAGRRRSGLAKERSA